MCGIGGFISSEGRRSEVDLIKINAVQEHRGPDSNGVVLMEHGAVRIGFAHARLAIIDESSGGHQPMKRGDLTITYNGEVYNYIEIRSELEKLGHTFSTSSDTEVILASYQEWGYECVQKFIGMFAFSIYDPSRSKVFFARDRVGVKPLYISLYDNEVLFSSELKAIIQLLGAKKSINKTALSLYLKHGYVPAPYSILNEAEKLEPGTYLVLDLDSMSTEKNKYWDSVEHHLKPKLDLSDEEVMSQAETLLLSSCKYRMVSDVPVGVFLSGGYDSTCVASLLQKDATSKLKTFTIGFEEQEFDESKYARDVSEHLGTDHTEYICKEGDMRSLFESLSFNFDEPFADSSAIPTMLVSKLAREKVTVALSADGGDELFAGYSRYDTYLDLRSKLQKVPSAFHRPLGKVIQAGNPLLKTAIPKGAYRRSLNLHILSDLLASNETRSEFLMREMSALVPERLIKDLQSGGVHQDQRSAFATTIHRLDGLTDVNAMTALDFETYLPDDIMCKVDRAAMFTSLEGREPLLDHRLVEFAAQLPANWKVRNGEKKFILKQIVHKYVPQSIMDRKKMGFGVPVHKWLREYYRDWLEEMLSPQALDHELFNVDKVQKLLRSYLDGDRMSFEIIWSVFMFQVWYHKWMKAVDWNR
ncbi:MAG: asparagine synthase (glutamine-hydrolyzing) [Flavobacteriia bacterium]|nr:asparagine synthase (glutamine-hydrolyzing) [Flavobacteriia bacterium]